MGRRRIITLALAVAVVALAAQRLRNWRTPAPEDRAWINVSNVRLLDPITTGQRSRIEFTFENIGKTAAVNVTLRAATLQITPFPLNENAPVRGAARIGGPITISAGGKETREGSTGVITPLQWDALHAGGQHRMTFVVLGDVQYQDVFTAVRTTKFCYFLADPERGDLTHCPNNNAAN